MLLARPAPVNPRTFARSHSRTFPHSMKLKPGKGKTLGGAPRSGKWTKHAEDTRVGGRHRGSLIALAVLGVLVLGGIGGYLAWSNAQLESGLLRQQKEMR